MTATAELQFTDPQVVTKAYQEVEVGSVTVIIPESQMIVGGEYKDEPDLVIEVRHAIDSDGLDVSASVARRIADLLAGA
jgi:predicted nucleotidyltransferase